MVLTFCTLSSIPFAHATSPTAKPQVMILRDSGTLKILQAEVLVDAPVASVWRELSDYANLKNMLPGYERSTVLQAYGPVKTVDLQVKPGSLLPAYRYQVAIHEDRSDYTLNIQRISGDFKAITAIYQLYPVDAGSRTRVVYRLSIDMGNNMPPMGAAGVLKSSTARAMTAIQGHCAEVYRRSLTAQASR